MPLATPEQHGALQMALEDISLQLLWPIPEVLERFPQSGPPRLHGVSWWWLMIIQAFDRMKHAEESEMAPAIDGLGFDGRGMDFLRPGRKRRRLNNVEMSEIIEYTNAFAAQNGVERRRRKEKVAA